MWNSPVPFAGLVPAPILHKQARVPPLTLEREERGMKRKREGDEEEKRGG